MLIGLVLSCLGIGFGGYYGFEYIKSFSSYSDQYGHSLDFNQDALFLMCLGILLVIIGLVHMYLVTKKLNNDKVLIYSLTGISLINLIYAIALLGKSYYKHKSSEIVGYYWCWFALSLVISCVFICYLYLEKRKKQEIETK